MDSSERNEMQGADDAGSGRLDRAKEKGRETMDRAMEKGRETMDRAKEGLSAGAAGVAEVGRNVATGTRDRAGRAVEIVRESETDEALKARVTSTTERSLDRAGDRVTASAPAIGRGAERVAETVGRALHAVGHPVAVILGTIAGTLGGWWKKAAEERIDFPESEDAACRAHFTSITVLPTDMSYERARTGYALGYVASRNPGYSGRDFEEIEPELRRGFGEQHASDYDALREFTRYGYGRGRGQAG